MSETTSQTLERLTAFIKEKAPTIDVSPGSVFSELILGLETQIQNQVYNDIDAISTAQAISDVESSLVDTYSPVIDRIASNYNVTRIQGAVSVGNIKVYVATQYNNYTLAAGTSFTQPTLGYTYVTTSAIVLNNLNTESGLYYFVVPASSTDIGEHTALTNGAPFTLSSTSSIPSFVRAEAYGTFSRGASPETDRQLIARFREGLAVSNLLTSASINNKLSTLYPSFCGAYIADTNSSVNKRTTNNILGIKMPGCVDVYVKNDVTIPLITFQADAYWDPIGNVWRTNIPVNAAPGFYRITSVTDAAATDLTYLPFSVTYGYETASPGNSLYNIAQARYTIYQTADVAITHTAPVGEEGATFNVTVMAPFDITSMQALFLDENNKIPCADYLVKGIVPCMVSMAISIVRNNPGDVIDIPAIQADIFDYVNSLTVGQPVAVSQIVNICHKYNIARVDLPLVLNGKILAPQNPSGNGADYDITISGNDFLKVPEMPECGVSANNTMFFLDYFSEKGLENISISVK